MIKHERPALTAGGYCHASTDYMTKTSGEHQLNKETLGGHTGESVESLTMFAHHAECTCEKGKAKVSNKNRFFSWGRKKRNSEEEWRGD